MTDVAPATDAKVPPPANAEDAKLASSATRRNSTARSARSRRSPSGSRRSAPPPRCSPASAPATSPRAHRSCGRCCSPARCSSLWAFIAADLTAKIPLAGYSYQWTSRINGSTSRGSPGSWRSMGWVCGMTGVGFILSGYLGGLFGWNMSQTAQILRRHRRDGRLHADQHLRRAVRDDGQQHRRQPRIGHHRRRDRSWSRSSRSPRPRTTSRSRCCSPAATSDGKDSYMLAWLAASLGPFFGLIGVESSADVAEETKNARHVMPAHDVLRADHLDRHRAADVHRLRAGDQGRRRRRRPTPPHRSRRSSPSRSARSSRKSLSPLP